MSVSDDDGNDGVHSQHCWISGATFLAKMSQLHYQKAFRLSPKVWYIVWGWLLQVDQWDRWFDWESNLRNEGATGFVDQVQHTVRRTLWCSCCGWLQADGAAVPLLSKPCGALKWRMIVRAKAAVNDGTTGRFLQLLQQGLKATRFSYVVPCSCPRRWCYVAELRCM